MRARGWALAAAVLAVAGCKTSTKSGDRAAASATGNTQETAQVEPGRSAGQSPRDAAESQAAEQAPSTRPSEGVGGNDPHPLPTGQPGEEKYGGDVAAPSQQAGTASAGGTSAGGTASGGVGASPGQSNEVSGRVALVDKQAHELAIDAGTSTTQVKVAPNAKITIDGKSASFDDLRQGAQVRATLDRSSGEAQATEIAVTHSKSPEK